MEFILDNYLVIILIGAFFVFALIGYLIDIIRKTNEIEKEEIPTNIKPVDIADISMPKVEKKEPIKKENEDKLDADDLLKSYDDSVSE